MRIRQSTKQPLTHRSIQTFVTSCIGGDLHAMRVFSLSNAATGVIEGASLAVHSIGRALAQVRSLDPKHAIKQVDRLFSNSGIDVPTLFEQWVPYVIGVRKDIVVALDWTEFDHDDHSTLALHMVTRHGRATPLMWVTVRKSKLKGRRNGHEDDLLAELRRIVPMDVRVTILADRGFGDAKLYTLLDELGLDYIIRFRGAIGVTDVSDQTHKASQLVPPNGRVKAIKDARVTAQKVHVSSVVLKKAKGMKESWCLATSRDDLRGSQVIDLYAKRFSIEETFRDTKDIHFGMGLSSTHIGTPKRRDRILLVSALAIVLVTLLGAAGEEIGLDRRLKANTVKRRTHSLFFQGTYYYGALPNMRQEQFERLVTKFGELVYEQKLFRDVFGII